VTRLLAINGSLRGGSYNGALLRAAASAVPEGSDFVVWRGLADIAPFSEDLAASVCVEGLRAELVQADAVLFATPEYNGSVPGALKNALDWVSQPFATNPLRGKPVAVIGASQGLFGAVWAQAELRKVLATMGARVDQRELPVPRAHEAFTADGALREPALGARLRAIVVDLAEGRAKLAA
jgi:chromate reductase